MKKKTQQKINKLYKVFRFIKIIIRFIFKSLILLLLILNFFATYSILHLMTKSIDHVIHIKHTKLN
jgi:hypothetical protein